MKLGHEIHTRQDIQSMKNMKGMKGMIMEDMIMQRKQLSSHSAMSFELWMKVQLTCSSECGSYLLDNLKRIYRIYIYMYAYAYVYIYIPSIHLSIYLS